MVSRRPSRQRESRAERILNLLEKLRPSPQYLGRLLVIKEGRLFFLKAEDIDWVEADGNYVRLHSGEKTYVLRRAISHLATSLDPKEYVRIHRSTIVNIDRVRELQPLSHGEFEVVMHDGTKLTWSRGYKDKLKSF